MDFIIKILYLKSQSAVAPKQWQPAACRQGNLSFKADQSEEAVTLFSRGITVCQSREGGGGSGE